MTKLDASVIKVRGKILKTFAVTEEAMDASKATESKSVFDKFLAESFHEAMVEGLCYQIIESNVFQAQGSWNKEIYGVSLVYIYVHILVGIQTRLIWDKNQRN